MRRWDVLFAAVFSLIYFGCERNPAASPPEGYSGKPFEMSLVLSDYDGEPPAPQPPDGITVTLVRIDPSAYFWGVNTLFTMTANLPDTVLQFVGAGDFAKGKFFVSFPNWHELPDTHGQRVAHSGGEWGWRELQGKRFFGGIYRQ